MAQPPTYTINYDYSDYQASNPGEPMNGAQLDEEFVEIKAVLDAINTNLAILQADDTTLNKIVDPDSLTTATLGLISTNWTYQGAWVTATAYAVGDVVTNGGSTYVCPIAHTSGTFSTDNTAGKWVITLSGTGAAGIIYDNGTSGLSATDVQAAIDEIIAGATFLGATLTSPVLTTPQINDTSADHQYIFAVSELAADRTVTLPLLTGNDEFVFKDHAQTLTNKTLTSPTINTPAMGADSIDAITEIAAVLKTGADAKLVTGTAGTSGNVGSWNADGDLVDAAIAVSDVALLSVLASTVAGGGASLIALQDAGTLFATDNVEAALAEVMSDVNAIEADYLTSSDWASPGAIGSSTPAAGDFTTLSASGAISADGGQVAFPATQNASAGANTLDDYEEGTWTPVLSNTVPGDMSVAYTTQIGTYVKIGQTVNCSLTIVTSSFTWSTTSGAWSVTGIPFNGFAGGSGYNQVGALEFSGITKASYTNFTIELGNAASQFLIGASGSGQVLSNCLAADFPSGGTVRLIGTITYRASA